MSFQKEKRASMSLALAAESARHGILPMQRLAALVDAGAVTSAVAKDLDQLQPASLDLRLKRGGPDKLYTADCGVDLTGDLVGFRARRHAGIIDLDHIGGHDPLKYW